jgi:formylglycine-generating enzyme required for sulfatase activity
MSSLRTFAQFLVAILAVPGCRGTKDVDPCADTPGACISVRVEGNLSRIDQIVFFLGTQMRATPTPADTFTLPVLVAVVPPAQSAGEVTLAADALYGGQVVAPRISSTVVLDTLGRGRVTMVFNQSTSVADPAAQEAGVISDGPTDNASGGPGGPDGSDTAGLGGAFGTGGTTATTGLGFGGKNGTGGSGGSGGFSTTRSSGSGGAGAMGGVGSGGTEVGGHATGGLGAGGAATGGTAGNWTCPGSGGPSMVKLPQEYCIDSTEVTRSQYTTWLVANPSVAAQIADCVWNTDFAPDAACMKSSSVCQTDCDTHPQVCIDWCDAYAYCQATGKHLCGKIGGGSVDPDRQSDIRTDEWFNACASHNTRASTQDIYVYGLYTANEQACNGFRYAGPRSKTVPVGSLATCQSNAPGYQGVFDLNGNVWEWEDSCTGPGRYGSCYCRGGAFDESVSKCDTAQPDLRYAKQANIGFRCCFSP